MIIALTGKRQSGKSEVANYLKNLASFEVVKFAQPLKDMLRAIGLTDREVEGEAKELPSDLLCGRTPREAMLTLGTEWGRQMIGDQLWVNLWQANIRTKGFPYCNIVTDDCRFVNEAEAVRKLGGIVIYIRRPSLKTPRRLHISDRILPRELIDHVVTNDGSKQQLLGQIGLIMEKYK